MTPALIGVTGVFVLFVLLIARVPVWIALVLVGFFGNAAVGGWPAAFALAGTAPNMEKVGTIYMNLYWLFKESEEPGPPWPMSNPGFPPASTDHLEPGRNGAASCPAWIGTQRT